MQTFSFLTISSICSKLVPYFFNIPTIVFFPFYYFFLYFTKNIHYYSQKQVISPLFLHFLS